MLVAVKTSRADFEVEGKIPPRLLTVLRRMFADSVRVLDPDEDELVNIFETDWYRDIRKRTTPGNAMRCYRENRCLTQEDLARKLGPGFKRQHVRDLERGRRPISKTVTKKLARIFQTSPARFTRARPKP